MEALEVSQALQDRSPNGVGPERRTRRTSCLAEALRYQLDACRLAEGLAAVVVSDALGFCVAHSGGEGVHDEIAAQLPILVGPAHPVLPDSEEAASLAGRPVVVTTFFAAETKLHVGAVKGAEAGDEGTPASTRAALDRVASGFTRMLG